MPHLSQTPTIPVPLDYKKIKSLLLFHLAKQFLADDYCCSIEHWWELNTITCCSSAFHSPSCSFARCSRFPETTALTSISRGVQTALLSIAGVGKWLSHISNLLYECSANDIWDQWVRDFSQTILWVFTWSHLVFTLWHPKCVQGTRPKTDWVIITELYSESLFYKHIILRPNLKLRIFYAQLERSMNKLFFLIKFTER